jgi:hypothetical protein
MIVILVMLFVFFLLRVASFKTAEKLKNNEGDAAPTELDEVLAERARQDAKVCPPHKWRHHEIKDSAGNLVSWKIICDLCGPLGSQDKR